MKQFKLDNVAATDALGSAIADSLPGDVAGWTLLLNGELGAGKSTLVRAMLRRLGHAGPVPSPTYTLVEPYDLGGACVYHIDLYRVGSEEELRYLGFNELDSGLRLVEWPDRAPRLAAEADVDIRLSYAGAGRGAKLVSISERGAQWLQAFAPRIPSTTLI